jgi:hypothetical protein
VRRGVRLFLVPGTLDRVQNLVPPVNAGARVLLTREQRRVVQVADDVSLISATLA